MVYIWIIIFEFKGRWFILPITLEGDKRIHNQDSPICHAAQIHPRYHISAAARDYRLEQARLSMSKFPFPLPHGWFGLCYAHELKAGDVKKVRFCARDVVLFRTESGAACALDNYCPHLGAPLSQGKVIGEAIRCPFHHWQWDGAGRCVEIPYANKIPERAVIESIPVREINGMILGWYDRNGKPPYFEAPELAPLNGQGDGWAGVEYLQHDLPTCVQEISENDVDTAHFPYLHGMPALTEAESLTEGPIKKTTQMFHTNEEFLVGEAQSDNEYMSFRESHGPGLVSVWSKNITGVTPGVSGEFLLYSVATPVEEDRTLLRWSMIISEELAEDDMGKTMLQAYPEGVLADIPIWAEKVYQPNPVLCDGDGPIAKHRKWFAQFYE